MGVKIESLKCIAKAYVERTPAGAFHWVVYNRTSGHIVALVHSQGMAERLAISLNSPDSCYTDGYEAAEIWKE